jgi:hypothetical protein
MNGNALRLSSRDGTGTRRWIVGDRDGKHAKVFRRSLSYLSPGDSPWMVTAWHGLCAAQFEGYRVHAAGCWTGRNAFNIALGFVAPIGKSD